MRRKNMKKISVIFILVSLIGGVAQASTPMLSVVKYILSKGTTELADQSAKELLEKISRMPGRLSREIDLSDLSHVIRVENSGYFNKIVAIKKSVTDELTVTVRFFDEQIDIDEVAPKYYVRKEVKGKYDVAFKELGFAPSEAVQLSERVAEITFTKSLKELDAADDIVSSLAKILDNVYNKSAISF